MMASPASLPKLRATTETSKLWVSRVWTKSVLEKGMTCVLSCKLRKAEENTIRS